MRARFGPLRGTAKRTQSSSSDVIFSHHSTGICLITQHFFARAVTSNRCPLRYSQLIQIAQSHSCPGSSVDRMCWSSVARMQRSNQNISRWTHSKLARIGNNKSNNKHSIIAQLQHRFACSCYTKIPRSFRKHCRASAFAKMWRCSGKVACVWLNGRSVRIMAPCARLGDYHPYRAGPPNPTQSSAMISSPAAPTAGLSIPGPSWDGLESREPLAKLASGPKPAKPH
jgi:hypothetical protein